MKISELVKPILHVLVNGKCDLGVGKDLVDVNAIRAGEAHVVTERTKQFVEIIREARTAYEQRLGISSFSVRNEITLTT